MAYKIISAIIALILFISIPTAVLAQGNDDLPVYIVQPGENLTEIAWKFHLTLDELIKANNLADINVLSAGTELVIPGLEGVSGILTAEPTSFGETYQSILRKYALSSSSFTQLNPVTSPSEIYAGSTLILPQYAGNEKRLGAYPGSQDSLFAIAIKTNQNIWALSQKNQLSATSLIPGDVIFYQSVEEIESESPFSNLITKVELNPLPAIQGHTEVVRIYTKEPAILSGSMGGKKLNFFQDQTNGFYYALTGISAIARTWIDPPGLFWKF